MSLTLHLKANELARLYDEYTAKFGKPPPEFPEGRKGGGLFEKCEMIAAAIDANMPLEQSTNGQRLLTLRNAYEAQFGVHPVSYVFWYGETEERLLETIQLFEAALADGHRRLLLEPDNQEYMSYEFLDDLPWEEYQLVRLDENGKPMPTENK